jgi:hypothetical protein
MIALQQARARIQALPRPWIVFTGVLLTACASESIGYPPVARIGADPRAIPESDAFRTSVTLDASGSADPIDDPERTRPLAYTWRIIGDEYRVEDGSLDAASVTVTLLGDRPATVQLTVADEDGNTATAQTQLQLTLRP